MAGTKPRKGYVYRNYVCRKCNLTAEFQGFKKDEEHIKSETSRRYKCPTCFPNDVDGGGNGFKLTEKIASRCFGITKFGDDVYERLGKDTLSLDEYGPEKRKLNEYLARSIEIWKQ